MSGRLSRQGTAERRAEALRMRRQGKTYVEIADALSYAGPGAASKDVSRALDRLVRDEGKRLLHLETERTEHLMAVLFPLAEGGDTKAARELIRLLDRRARMLGIDRAGSDLASAADIDEAKGILGRFMEAVHTAAAEQDDDSSTQF